VYSTPDWWNGLLGDSQTYDHLRGDKTFLKVCRFCVAHFKRCQYTSSHFMANYARTSAPTDVWFPSSLEGLANTCQQDCNIWCFE
jgi:hypothetical protein